MNNSFPINGMGSNDNVLFIPKSGTSGTSSTSGVAGTSGTSGTSGTNGNGTSGTSGTNGNGTSGTSGISNSNHASLYNLDYDNAGHIGFQKQLIYDLDLKVFIID